MGELPTLSLEFGASETRSIHCSWQNPATRHGNTCRDMKDIQALCCDEAGIDLEFLPYEGGEGILLSGGGGNYDFAAGGARPTTSEWHLSKLIDTYNRHGFGFMVAMNGGVMLNPEVQFDVVNDARFRNEMRVLQLLEESAQKHGVQNWVTIYRDELLEVIREHFPKLGTIASCIRFVGGLEGHFRGTEEEYRIALRDFNRVCPLNQHIHPDFLEQFGSGHMDQWVLLATSWCARADLRRCLRHYRVNPSQTSLADRGILPHEVAALSPRESELDTIFPGVAHLPSTSSAPAEGFLTTRDQCFHGLARLTDRKLHLDRLTAMGITKFKFPRTTGRHMLDDSNLKIVIESFASSLQRPH